MDGILSLVVAGSMWGFGVCRDRGIPSEEQGEEGQRKDEEFAEVGDSGWEPDAGASVVIWGLWLGLVGAALRAF